MPRFSANLSFLFGEKPFLERFDACRKAGFRFVEYAFPYEFDPDAIKKRLVEHGLIQVLFNLPPGDWAAGQGTGASLPIRVGSGNSRTGWTGRWNTHGCWTSCG